MKKIFTIVIVIASMNIGAFAQSSWFWQNPLPQGNTLRDVFFIENSTTGLAVGSNGTILKTINSGTSWTIQTSGTINELYSLHFENNNIGWVVGVLGSILKTTNGGTNWAAQSSGTINRLESVHFIDSNTGWSVGASGTILKTTNGGENWTTQTNGEFLNLKDVHFFDNNTGLTCSGNKIFRTTNGGENWTPQTISIWNFHFEDNNTGWGLGNSGTILKTINGGSNWMTQSSGTTNSLYSVHFTDNNIGWVVGAFGTILKTTNGGTNWAAQSSGITSYLYSVNFADNSIGLAVGPNGRILKTTNGGSNWMMQSSEIISSLYSVHFANNNTGWVAGAFGTILKTTNGGMNWAAQSSGLTTSLYSVIFIDNNTGWVVGASSRILKTTNGGENWTPQTNLPFPNLSFVHFLDNNTGWVVGGSGIIIKTIDGGNNWTTQTSGINNILYSVHFTDNNTGWVVGSSGKIIKTTNGGMNWIQQTSGTPRFLYSVHFINDQTGWVVGNNGTGTNGTVLKTTNGGTNWILQESGTSKSLESVQFADNSNGWAVGYQGTIIRTTNGGTNWITQTSGTDGNLNSMHFINPSIVWAVGEGGIILKYNSSALLVITHPNGGETLLNGQQVNLTWNYQAVQSVKIEFTSNNGSTWSTLSASYPAESGLFAWTVPNINSTQCKIKITDANDPGIYDISDSSFTIAPVTLNTGLIAYYPFNGNVNDESGNNNHGTINGATFTTDINESQDYALDFNGISDFVSIPDFNILNYNKLTFSCIIYPRSLNTSVIAYHGYSGEIQINTYNGTQLGVGVKLEDNNWYFSNVNALPNNWYLLTGVWERGNSIKLYLNGQLQSQNSVPDLDLYEDVFHNSSIGAYSRFMFPPEARPFNGKIDEVRFYNRALSQSDIQKLYNQALAFTKPGPYSKWISGESDTIRWKNQGWTSYDIKCLLNYGTPNQSVLIIDSFITDTSYVWNIPSSLLSLRSKIIIQNSDDFNQSIESNIFRIKPYMLTKLNPDSTYYAYTIGRDNWRYENGRTNFWFENWYNQFNYLWIDPFTGRFFPPKYFLGAFENDFPDWVSWVNAFSINACYSNFDNGEYYQTAITRWKAEKRRNAKYPGSCFGIALSNAMAFNYKSQFLRRYSDFPEFTNPHDVIINDNVRKITNELWTHQKGQPHKKFLNNSSFNTFPRETLESLKDLLIEDNCIIKMLGIVNLNNSDGGGHMILPYKVEKLYGDGEYSIMTYDNNTPDIPQSFLIKTLENGGNGSWSSQKYDTWGGAKGIILSDEVYKYFFTPVLEQTNETSPFTVEDSLLQIYNPGNADFIIKDETGNVSGTINDSSFNNIENSFPAYSFGGFEVPPYMFNLQSGSYSVTLKNFNSDKIESYLFTGNKSFTYSRGEISSNQTDVILFDGNITALNEDVQAKQIALSSIIKESTNEKVVIVKSLNLQQNDSVKLVNIHDEDFKIISSGSQKQYELELNYVSPSGTNRFINSSIILSNNSSHTILPEWNNISNGTLTILEDIGNNGTIDDTIYLSNFYSDLNLVLNAFIEGSYNDVTNRMVSDTVTILLREKFSPFAIIDYANAVLSPKGKGFFTFHNAQQLTSYFIVVKHRNAIQVWSDSTISLSANSTYSYSFVDTVSHAYGNNLVKVDSSPIRFALYSGDVNQDGTVDITDGSLIDNDAFNFTSGYIPTDVNGDLIVDVADAVFADNNAMNFISVITP